MGDAYQCHLRVHLVVTKYFHLGLPLVMNDYLWDPLGVKLVNWFSSLETLEADSMNSKSLFGRLLRIRRTGRSKTSSKCSPERR